LNTSCDEILGKLAARSDFDPGRTQRDAWVEGISVLQTILSGKEGSIYFGYAIPRMGKRIDATRVPASYDPTFSYLKDIGFSTL
jgi:hypothetical protein